MKEFCVIFIVLMILSFMIGCNDDSPNDNDNGDITPVCSRDISGRIDVRTPESVVSDWGTPIRVSAPVNSPCPEDAIEISGDGQYLYFLFTPDLLDSLTPNQILSLPSGTYRAHRNGNSGEFDTPIYYDLGKGVSGSLDGELSFSPDGQKVYFHSNRATNTGYQNDPYYDDFLDIYVADITDGLPGPGVNLGQPVNSVYPDGEHAIHPDGVTLYFSSTRPDGLGGSDIWISSFNGASWSEPVNAGTPLNSSADDLQPTFTADGDTVYFTSARNILTGAAIYRSVKSGDGWSSPEMVIRGLVGEASLTDDGQYLYFVHILEDGAGRYDADIWYSQRVQ